MEEEQYNQKFQGFMSSDQDKIMGANSMNVPQMEVGGMENHPQHRLMGIHPDEPMAPEYPMQQVPQQMPDNNPFNGQQYEDVNLPDAPVSYGGGIAENLINDNEVPKEVKLKYWWVLHKDNTLTFLDEARKASKLLNFDILKIDTLNATPYYEYTFEKELEFNLMRNVYETKLDRALGMKGGTNKNERIMLQSQFSESRHINEDGNNNQIKGGFFSRLMNRR